MLIPNRHIARPKEDPRVVEVIKEAPPADHSLALAEIQKILDKKKPVTKWVFSILRDKDDLMTEVVATTADTDTII